MKRRPNLWKRKRTETFNPLSWAAGVIEAKGHVRLRYRNGAPYAGRVWVTCHREVGEMLSEILGGRWYRGRWVLWRKEERALVRILPYLRTPSMIEDVRVLMRFRTVQPILKPGESLSKAVKVFREERF